MTRWYSRLISFVAALLLFPLLPSDHTSLARAAEPVMLVKDGKSEYVIVLPAVSQASERRAANELQTHIKAMSGAELKIITDEDPLPVRAILLGANKHLAALEVKLDSAVLKQEGFIIKTVGERLIIAGPGPRGTMYGASEVLEKLGVRWYTPTVTRAPVQTIVVLPPLDETQTPAFEYREPFFTEAWNKDWAARLRINGGKTELDESTGGKIRFEQHWCHTLDALVPPPLFATHPEYFPVIKGKRTNGYVQRCLSNPDVLKLCIDGVRAWIRQEPDATLFSVSQNDTANWCECDQCKAIETKYGGQHSGLYVWFVNQVAENIAKEHPEKLIDTLAYQFTEPPPTGIKPAANVRIRLCPIANCEGHPYESCTSAANVAFLRNLKGWDELTDVLYIWHYCTDFGHYLLPFPDFNQFPDSTRLYKRSGVRGIFFQGAYPAGGGGSDAELRSYVMARLLWNPDANAEALVSEWMNGVYGKAAPPMRKWFDLLHEKMKAPTAHLYISTSPTDAPYLNDEVIATGDALYDEAEKLAAGDPIGTTYVAKSRLWLRYAKLMRKPDGGEAFKSFTADLRKFGITSISEGQGLDAWEKAYAKQYPPK